MEAIWTNLEHYPYTVMNEMETTYTPVVEVGFEDVSFVEMTMMEGKRLVVKLPDYKIVEDRGFNMEEKAFALNYVTRHGILIWDLARSGGFNA
ncbi:MAG: hypothetical protein FWF59_04540 [Turicibacter sp.]|nr:hypothetical protein [Turicibacter sp.]